MEITYTSGLSTSLQREILDVMRDPSAQWFPGIGGETLSRSNLFGGGVWLTFTGTNLVDNNDGTIGGQITGVEFYNSGSSTIDATITGLNIADANAFLIAANAFISFTDASFKAFLDALDVGPALVTGTDGKDVLEGTSGNDILRGGKGADVFIVGEGDDVFNGGGGKDGLTAAELGSGIFVGLLSEILTHGATTVTVKNVETVFGTDFDDDISGDAGDNKLLGGTGHDILNGEGGNDILKGGSGKDQLSGGSGNDVLKGGEGRDKLNGGTGDDVLSGGSHKDILRGGDGDDILDGDGGDDALSGGKNSDTLNGGSGADYLDGGRGVDTLNGGDGDDVIKGGRGDDTLTGGDGYDEFDFYDGEGSQGNDTITDFEAGVDTIWLQGESIDFVQVDHVFGDTVITYLNGTITIENQTLNIDDIDLLF